MGGIARVPADIALQSDELKALRASVADALDVAQAYLAESSKLDRIEAKLDRIIARMFAPEENGDRPA
jgi:hypothetical protein